MKKDILKELEIITEGFIHNNVLCVYVEDFISFNSNGEECYRNNEEVTKDYNSLIELFKTYGLDSTDYEIHFTSEDI